MNIDELMKSNSAQLCLQPGIIPSCLTSTSSFEDKERKRNVVIRAERADSSQPAGEASRLTKIFVDRILNPGDSRTSQPFSMTRLEKNAYMNSGII